MAAWSFHRRRGICSGCERAFQDGETHHSALSVLGEGVVRADLCGTCWPARRPGLPSPEEGPLRPVYWWRTRHQDGRRGLALNLDAIAGLFLGLEGRAEARVGELRYVLCLILMRKRRLKLERVHRTGQSEALIVRRPGRKEELAVPVFSLDAERKILLRDELRALFDAEDGALTALGLPPEGAPLHEADADAS